MIKLNVTTVIGLLLSAIEDRGFGYVYEKPSEFTGCMYVHNTSKKEEEWVPGCIVGYVLNKAGLTLAQLKEHEHNHVASVIGSLVCDGVLEIDDESINLLQSVQVRQDDEQAWGEAVIASLGNRLRAVGDELKRSEKISEDRFKRIQQIRDLTRLY